MMMWRLIIRYPSRPCMVLMAIMKAMDPSWSIAKSRQHEIAALHGVNGHYEGYGSFMVYC